MPQRDLLQVLEVSMPQRDLLQVLDVFIDASARLEPVEEAVEICGLVYGFDVRATAGATLKLQGTEVIVGTGEDPLHFDLPGLRWPAHARFIAEAGSVARLRVAYGACNA